MTGPYEYVSPSYWLVDSPNHPSPAQCNEGGCGGAYGFNTETSPGPAVPPLESLERFLPKDHLWPIDEYWNYHAGGGSFKDIHVFTDALNARYGKAEDVRDFAMKSQLMTYEGIRAMYEAYSRNKYTSTGVIQWMLNNAWPSLIWHLYDYYLRRRADILAPRLPCSRSIQCMGMTTTRFGWSAASTGMRTISRLRPRFTTWI